MKTIRTGLALLLLLLAVGCSSPESRIQGNAAAFNSWPAGVQQKIRAGQIDLGFTEEMVLVAIGWPDGKRMRTTAEGTTEVWTYADRGLRFALGVGVGMTRGASAYDSAVAVSDDGFRGEEMLLVIFTDGRVSAVERRRK